MGSFGQAVRGSRVLRGLWKVGGLAVTRGRAGSAFVVTEQEVKASSGSLRLCLALLAGSPGR